LLRASSMVMSAVLQLLSPALVVLYRAYRTRIVVHAYKILQCVGNDTSSAMVSMAMSVIDLFTLIASLWMNRSAP
jgi:hypothetical protein